MTVTHTHRWHAHNHTAGEGPLYQGRSKSFPVEADAHFLIVCRYVEANAVRAELWRWSSLWSRRPAAAGMGPWLAEWPVGRPRGWLAEVNRPMREQALNEVRQAAMRGTPLGTDRWRTRVASRLKLDLPLRPRGRPRKQPEKSS